MPESLKNMCFRFLPRTLFGQIALAFWGLLVTLMLVQVFFAYPRFLYALNQVNQKLNWGIAENYAGVLSPFLNKQSNCDTAKVHEVIRSLEEAHPQVEIHLVSHDGRILFDQVLKEMEETHLHNYSAQIDTAPIVDFITPRTSRDAPVFGDDPKRPGKTTVFSAARTNICGTPGYVYVNLISTNYRVLSEVVAGLQSVFGGISILGLLVLVTACIGSVVFFVITKRFARLKEGVAAFGAGNLEKRVAVVGNDEIGLLAYSFNNMADSIVENIDQIKKGEAERRAMLAMLSHDLSGPIAAAQGHLQRLQRDLEMLDETERKDSVSIAFRNVQALGALVKQLFELAKLEAREEQFDFIPFSIVDIVEDEIIPRYRLAAEGRGVSLRVECGDQVRSVLGDVEMIERVLSNLVQNAIRYSGGRGEIVVSLQELGEKVSISVSDQGIGISPEDVPHIFDPFYRAEGKAKKEPGTGLGLAIIKRIVELHNEEIHVESTLGSGTCFSFALPIAALVRDNTNRI